MNDEQSKRIADAADAVISATDSLDEVREALADKRFDSEQERDRTQAVQQVASKLDNAGKKIDEALRKGTVASAALGRNAIFPRFRQASVAVKEGRSLARTAADQDGTAAKRQRAEESLAKLDAAVVTAASIVFGE